MVERQIFALSRFARAGLLAAVAAVSYVFLAGAAFAHEQTQPAENPDPAKMKHAMKLYIDGMRALNGDGRDKNLNEAEKLFTKATVEGLPHGHYGLACVIYQKHDKDRERQAGSNMVYAAEHGVIAAKAALVNYYATGYGFERGDLHKAHQALHDLISFAESTPEEPDVTVPDHTIAPETVVIVGIVLNRNKCAPPLEDINDVMREEGPLQYQPLKQRLDGRH